jgi:hypothetical protein
MVGKTHDPWVMTLKHRGSQTGKHEKPDLWKRQETKGKNERKKEETKIEEKKSLHFPLIPALHYNFDNM